MSSLDLNYKKYSLSLKEDYLHNNNSSINNINSNIINDDKNGKNEIQINIINEDE